MGSFIVQDSPLEVAGSGLAGLEATLLGSSGVKVDLDAGNLSEEGRVDSSQLSLVGGDGGVGAGLELGGSSADDAGREGEESGDADRVHYDCFLKRMSQKRVVCIKWTC